MSCVTRAFSYLTAGSVLALGGAAQAELVSAWYFEDGEFLTDSVGSNDLSAVGTGTVAQAGGAAVFTGSDTALLQVGAGTDFVPGTGAGGVEFSVELIFTLDTVPPARASLLNEVVNFGSTTRGFDLYLGSAGNVVTEIGNSGNQNSTFVNGNGGNSSNPFVLEAGKTYRLGAAYDFSGVNNNVSDFEAYSVLYLLENLTDGTSLSTTVTGTARNVANNSAALFTIGGRFDNSGTMVAQSNDVNIEAVGVYDSLITELTLNPVPEPGSMALLACGALAIFYRGRSDGHS